jgi:hypothetical protein
MSGRPILSTACALAISVGALNASLAQSDLRPMPAPASALESHWTVVTMSPDGSWGAATKISTGRAIASAINACKMMSQAQIGCGAQFKTNRGGWTFGIRCGTTNIIVAEKTLVEAEHAAINREVNLRMLYVPDMPPCIRVVSVDPHGAIVAPNVADLVRMVKNWRDGSSR